MENVWQEALKPFLSSSSIHNQCIEHFWRYMWTRCAWYYKHMLTLLEQNGVDDCYISILFIRRCHHICKSMEPASCEKDQWKHTWDQWTCSRWYFQVIRKGTWVCTSILIHNIGNKSWKGSWVYYFNVHFCWFYIVISWVGWFLPLAYQANLL
jgi:hypothetical protein